MTQYGSIPGVRITTESGTVSGVTIGREQYHILVGAGHPDDANVSASANDPINIGGLDEAETEFGEGSDLANAYDRSTNNGANSDYVVGVKASVTEEVETVSDTTNPLAETPILANPDRVSATDTSDASSLDVVFEFGSTLSTPGTNEVIINPYTGDIESDATGDTEVTYDWADWGAAFTAATDYLTDGDFAVLTPLTVADQVATALDDELTTAREEELKMAVGVMGAQYNDTATGGGPKIDAANYTSSIASDVMWRGAPVHLEDNDVKDRYVGALSAVSGIFAGNPTTDPIYDDTVTVNKLGQGLTRSDITDLRGQYIVPVRDTGIVRIEDNHSTYDQSTSGGWERDFFKRRIVDLTTITARRVARRQIGGILTGGLVDDVGEAVELELGELADDGLLNPGEQVVDSYRKDDTTIGLDLKIAPFGVAKAAEVTLTIDA